MFVSDSNLDAQLALLGNIEGPNRGDCLVRLPGGGEHTVASGSLRLYAEGVTGVLPDGRRFFSHTSGLVVIDLPHGGQQPADPGQEPGQ